MLSAPARLAQGPDLFGLQVHQTIEKASCVPLSDRQTDSGNMISAGSRHWRRGASGPAPYGRARKSKTSITLAATTPNLATLDTITIYYVLQRTRFRGS